MAHDNRAKMDGRIRLERPLRIGMAASLLLLLGLSLMLPGLGESGLWDPWEPKYAQAPREMAARGSFVIPYFHGEPRLNKPPLTYWLIGASQALFGVTEAAARLPSALFAALCPVALALAFALRGRELEGVLAGAALLTAPQWLLLGRFATPDVPLAALLGILLAACVAAPAIPSARGKRVLVALAIAALAGAGLVDWPRGWLLPAWAALAWAAARMRGPWLWALVAASALYLAGQQLYSVPLNLAAIAVVVLGGILVARSACGISWRALLAAAGAVLLLAAPWFIVAWRLEPQEMSVFEYKHALNLGEDLRQHEGSPDYVARIVAVGGLPWSAAAVLGLLLAFRRRERDELACVLAGAALGPLLFFTLAEPQMGHFYVVMQPAVAGLAGLGIRAALHKLDWRAIPAATVLALAGFAVWTRPSRILETATVKSNLYGEDIALPLLLAAGSWLVLLAIAKIRGRASWAIASVLPAALFAGVLGMRILPALESRKSIKPLWQAFEANRREGEPIALAGEVKFGCYYYSDNAILELDSGRDLLDYLAGPGQRYLVLPKGDYRKMLAAGPPLPGRFEALYEEHPSHLLARWTRIP